MKNKVIQFPVSTNHLNLIKGQYVQIDINEKDGSSFHQSYVVDVFDTFVLVKWDDGTLFKYDFDTDDKKYELVVPTRDGKRVMAKKNIFGRYTTEPDMR